MTERIEALTKILMETLKTINFENLSEQVRDVEWAIRDYYNFEVKGRIVAEMEKYQKINDENRKEHADRYAQLMTEYNNLLFENKVLKDRVKYFEDLLIKGAKQP